MCEFVRYVSRCEYICVYVCISSVCVCMSLLCMVCVYIYIGSIYMCVYVWCVRECMGIGLCGCICVCYVGV